MANIKSMISDDGASAWRIGEVSERYSATKAAESGYSAGDVVVGSNGVSYVLNADKSVLLPEVADNTARDALTMPGDAVYVPVTANSGDYDFWDGSTFTQTGGQVQTPVIGDQAVNPVGQPYSGPRADWISKVSAAPAIIGPSSVASDLQSEINASVSSPLYLSEGLHRVEAQLIVPAGAHITMHPNCELRRVWGGSVGDNINNAMFKNANCPSGAQIIAGSYGAAMDDGIYIEGGLLSAEASSHIGVGYLFHGVTGLRMKDTAIQRMHQSWAYAIGGDDIHLENILLKDGQAVFEDGVHIYGGQGIKISFAPGMQAGDDILAIGTNYDYACQDIEADISNARSVRGHAVRLIKNREGITNGYAEPSAEFRDIKITGSRCRAGILRNGLIRSEAGVNDGGGSRQEPSGTQMHDITIRDITIDSDDEGGSVEAVNRAGFTLEYIDGLVLDNVGIKNPPGVPYKFFHCEAVMKNCWAEGAGGTTTVLLDESDVSIVGGKLGHPTNTGITADNDSTLILSGNVRIPDVATNNSAVIVDGDSTLFAELFQPSRASGATGTNGIRTNGTANTNEVYANGLNGTDIDRPLFISAVPRVASVRGVNLDTTLTINFGNVSVSGHTDVYLLGQSGATDSISNITGGYVGQRIKVRSGEASPGTVVITLTDDATTDANKFSLASDMVLDTATKHIVLEYMSDSRWHEVSREPVAPTSTSSGYTSVPASATATGTAGQWAADTNYHYDCVATNTWRRTPLSTW